ncbi:MAG: hypothetical protein AAF958_11125 [Planctomycetota bacterium]
MTTKFNRRIPCGIAFSLQPAVFPSGLQRDRSGSQCDAGWCPPLGSFDTLPPADAGVFSPRALSNHFVK